MEAERDRDGYRSIVSERLCPKGVGGELLHRGGIGVARPSAEQLRDADSSVAVGFGQG
jgi:hypothetical protein